MNRSLRFVAGVMLLSLGACSSEKPETGNGIDMPKFEAGHLIQGRSVWMNTCRNCHLLGIAGAPAVTDLPAWEPRVEKGKSALYLNALSGVRGEDGQYRMPPRGGNQRLSDAQVRMAVDYMVAAVRELNGNR